MITISRKSALVLVSALSLGGSLLAQPEVSYTSSGSSGDYTLDFTVQNNLNPGMDIYYFGVLLSQPNITGSPGDFGSAAIGWNNASAGGSSIVYNNIWLDNSYSSLPAGNSLSGFDVQISNAVAPTSVEWFVYAYYGEPWTGGGNFNTDSNPGFEGIATLSNVPDAGSTMAMLGGAFAAMGAFARRSRKS